ncbi:MAG: proteasome subunit alpha [Nitrospirota bacterium]|nr:MAG: proteasome subunit alpha [Nitrospirota bacterium]
MYEEPYRWIEAVGNRRQYLDDQFQQGAPIVALSYLEGILLVTFSRGTPKLYEIYDRIALGGMGHPADLEKLRFNLLDMAHVEGFNRSPSDVTGNRLMKYSLAPMIKQAFEEIFKAPFIAKILLAEVGPQPDRDQFLTIDYDGSFEENRGCAVIAATSSIRKKMLAFLKTQNNGPIDSLQTALDLAVKTWALGSLLHHSAESLDHQDDEDQQPAGAARSHEPDEKALVDHIRLALSEKSLECALLDRTLPGSSKYRNLPPDQTRQLLPALLQPAV